MWRNRGRFAQCVDSWMGGHANRRQQQQLITHTHTPACACTAGSTAAAQLITSKRSSEAACRICCCAPMMMMKSADGAAQCVIGLHASPKSSNTCVVSQQQKQSWNRRCLTRARPYPGAGDVQKDANDRTMIGAAVGSRKKALAANPPCCAVTGAVICSMQ